MRNVRIWSLVSTLMVFALVFTACAAPPASAPAADDGTAAEATEAPAEEAAGEEAAADGEVIEIEYWQYFFEARQTAMNELIAMFEAEHPNIKIVHNSDLPYDNYRDQIAASAPAGVGPDVATLFYGWQPAWVDAGFIVPLPAEEFPPEMVAEVFSPMVQASFFEGELYTLPTAVRTLALFYNKDLMEAAGLDPENPPTTLDELKEQAVACTVKDGDEFEVYGFHVNPTGQEHHWFREVLLRQFGQQPYSDDYTQVQWNAGDGGYEAWNEFLAFETELGTGVAGIYENVHDGFLAGEVCFHIDGSFRLGTIASNAPDLNFGVTELPEHNGVKSTFGSYWTHGITQKGASDPARLAAATEFVKFITSPEAGRVWVDIVGELPAQLEAAADPELLADEKLGAFAAGLEYANSTFFADESLDRQAVIDAYNGVVLADGDPAEELDFAVQTVQEVLDDFWSDRE